MLLFALVLLLALSFGGTLWCGVCALLAWGSGWRAMAQRYRGPEGLRGAALASGFANLVGWVSHRATLSFEATPQGLIARVIRIFPFHPTLLIPWQAVRLQRGGAVFAAGTLTVPEGQSFTLNSDAMGAIERALASNAQAYGAAH